MALSSVSRPLILTFVASLGFAITLPAQSANPPAAPENTPKVSPDSPARPLSTPARPLSLSQIGAALTAAFVEFTGDFEAKRGQLQLPDSLSQAVVAVRASGNGELVENLNRQFNMAAANALPEILSGLKASLAETPWQNSRTLFSGNLTGATQFAKTTLGSSLGARLLPVMRTHLASAGVPEAYSKFLSQAGTGTTLDARADLTQFEELALGRTLDQIFDYLASREAALRADPTLSDDPAIQQTFRQLARK